MYFYKTDKSFYRFIQKLEQAFKECNQQTNQKAKMGNSCQITKLIVPPPLA